MLWREAGCPRKCPGTRPRGIGEVCRHLIAKLILRALGVQARYAFGSANLFEVLEVGIEGGFCKILERVVLRRGEAV